MDGQRKEKQSHLGAGKHTVFRDRPKMSFWANDREFLWKIRKERLIPGIDLCQDENGVLNILEAHERGLLSPCLAGVNKLDGLA